MTERAVALGLLGAGLLGAVWLTRTPSSAEFEPPEETRPIVSVRPVRIAAHAVEIDLQGTVRAARSLTLVPEVGGRVVHQHPSLRPGAVVKKGEVLLRIDPRSFRLEIARQQASVRAQQLTLEEEAARHEVAKWELGLLKDRPSLSKGAMPPGLSDRLSLRTPHLRSAEAAVRGARAALEQAQIRLSQTTLLCPFDALVLSENVEEGQVVSAGAALATLVGSDAYWVEATLPIQQVPFVAAVTAVEGVVDRSTRGTGAGEPAFPVTVRHRPGTEGAVWEGRVVDVLGDLDAGSRMARVLIEVRDPLSGTVPLLLGAFVHVHIRGLEIADVARIPRGAVDAVDRVWTVGSNDKLARRSIQVVFRERETLLVQGLRQSEFLVLAPRETYAEGMAVRQEIDGWLSARRGR